MSRIGALVNRQKKQARVNDVAHRYAEHLRAADEGRITQVLIAECTKLRAARDWYALAAWMLGALAAGELAALALVLTR